MKIIRTTLLCSLCLMALNVSAAPKKTKTTRADQERVAVTIYNNNLALIRDVRNISLTKGVSNLEYRDVSAQIRPETAQLVSLSKNTSLAVLEQNFNFDLLTPEKILEKYVGKNITVIKTNTKTGKETLVKARVLSAQNGVVLNVGGKIETGLPGRIVYDSVPKNLYEQPTLEMLLQNQESRRQKVGLSYLTGGLSWKADYVMNLSEDDKSVNLSGWITLNNTSGTDYKNAKIQLVAGDVNQVSPQPRRYFAMSTMESKVNKTSTVKEEALFEYHLYSLDRRTTIADNQSKQVALLSASQVPVTKQLVLSGPQFSYYRQFATQKQKVNAYVEFDNKTEAKLGMPLPKGIVRVYKKDSDGRAQFVGEDSIDHTPKNEQVRLKLGKSFDVTAKRTQTDFSKTQSNLSNKNTYRSSYEIELKNAKKDVVTVRVEEPISGDWEITEQSHSHKKTSSRMATWDIRIPAEGVATLKYSVKVKN